MPKARATRKIDLAKPQPADCHLFEARVNNRLCHMLDAAKAVCQHTSGKQLSDLEKDRLLLGGVIRELLLIGEAANAVSPQTQAEVSTIPWREVIGMRNQLVHRVIWSTIQEDIPRLIAILEVLLK